MKYVILADSRNKQPFEIPRQLIEINNEKLIERTIRLLRENNVEDILITAHDKRFNNLNAKIYKPLYNDYDPIKNTGYWLNAFSIELLNEPICFLFGDCYYSENAIKTIVKTETNSTLFFCTYQNTSIQYIKHHDEPLAYKVVDYELFKEHINKVKQMQDKGLCCRHPIVWELYRSINNQDINIHKMSNNYIAINDISCDIDNIDDIEKLKEVIGGKMIKVEVVENFTLERFNELENIERKNLNTYGKLYVGDKFECSKDLADYLLGNNHIKKQVVKLIEIEPELPTNQTGNEITQTDEEIKPEKKTKKSKKNKK